MVGKVGQHNPCPPAGAVNRHGQPFGILAGIVSMQHNAIPGSRESERDNGADAPSCAGDERSARIFCDVVSHSQLLLSGSLPAALLQPHEVSLHSK